MNRTSAILTQTLNILLITPVLYTIPESEGITLIFTGGKSVVIDGTVAASINHEQNSNKMYAYLHAHTSTGGCWRDNEFSCSYQFCIVVSSHSTCVVTSISEYH